MANHNQNQADSKADNSKSKKKDKAASQQAAPKLSKAAITAANKAARIAKATKLVAEKKAQAATTAHGTARAAKREETLRLKKELQEAIAWDKAKKEKELYDKDIAYATKHFPDFMGEYGEGQYLQRDELRELCKAINALEKKGTVFSYSCYLAGIFIWSVTIQGFDYWNNVNDAIRDRKESVQENLQ